jgi:hypothetical protein
MKRIMNFIEARTSGTSLKKRYPQVVAEIENIVAATSMGYQNLKIPLWKNADLMRILEHYQPRRLCEFGSGTTTASFNAWVKVKPDTREGITFESHPQWYRIISDSIAFSEGYSYILSGVHQHGNAAAFHEKPTCLEPDFVYIDAPPIEGQVEYNSDFIWIIDNHPLPRVFVVDVRYKTVSEMYKVFKERSLNYRLYVSREFPVELLGPNADYELGKDVRHSIFELK